MKGFYSGSSSFVFVWFLFSGFSNDKALEERELLQKLNKIEEKIDFNYNVLNKHLVRMMPTV